MGKHFVKGEGFEAALTAAGEVYIKMKCGFEMIGAAYFPLALSAEFFATVSSPCVSYSRKLFRTLRDRIPIDLVTSKRDPALLRPMYRVLSTYLPWLTFDKVVDGLPLTTKAELARLIHEELRRPPS